MRKIHFDSNASNGGITSKFRKLKSSHPEYFAKSCDTNFLSQKQEFDSVSAGISRSEAKKNEKLTEVAIEDLTTGSPSQQHESGSVSNNAQSASFIDGERPSSDLTNSVSCFGFITKFILRS